MSPHPTAVQMKKAEAKEQAQGHRACRGQGYNHTQQSAPTPPPPPLPYLNQHTMLNLPREVLIFFTHQMGNVRKGHPSMLKRAFAHCWRTFPSVQPLRKTIWPHVEPVLTVKPFDPRLALPVTCESVQRRTQDIPGKARS